MVCTQVKDLGKVLNMDPSAIRSVKAADGVERLTLPKSGHIGQTMNPVWREQLNFRDIDASSAGCFHGGRFNLGQCLKIIGGGLTM